MRKSPLRLWTKKLLSLYWDGCDQIKNLLESCPIWPDFKSHLVYKEKNVEFGWGKVVTIYSSEEYETKIWEYIGKLEKEYKNIAGVEALEKFRKKYGTGGETKYIINLEKVDKYKKDEEELKS